MPATHVEVHLTRDGIEHYQPGAPEGQTLVEAIIEQRFSEREIPHVMVGVYRAGQLSEVLFGSWCAWCGAPASVHLDAGGDGRYRLVCGPCAGPDRITLREYTRRCGVRAGFYHPRVVAEATVEYQVRRAVGRLLLEVKKAADVTAFRDPVSRREWLAEKGSAPANFVSLVSALTATGEVLEYQDELRRALAPHAAAFHFLCDAGTPPVPTLETILVLLRS